MNQSICANSVIFGLFVYLAVEKSGCIDVVCTYRYFGKGTCIMSYFGDLLNTSSLHCGSSEGVIMSITQTVKPTEVISDVITSFGMTFLPQADSLGYPKGPLVASSGLNILWISSGFAEYTTSTSVWTFGYSLRLVDK